MALSVALVLGFTGALLMALSEAVTVMGSLDDLLLEGRRLLGLDDDDDPPPPGLLAA